MLPGSYEIEFDQEQLSFDVNGIEAFIFCNDWISEISSLASHAETLLGGLGVHGYGDTFSPAVPDYMAQSNIRFLKKYMGYELVERPLKSQRYNTTYIDESMI